MIMADLKEMEGYTYPAGRKTKNLVGGASPLRAKNFCMGYVAVRPNGGQVPWHNHQQEEVYFILEGEGEIAVGEELNIVTGGQIVYIPENVFHQVTNVGGTQLLMIYCYGPAGEVAHWRQELEGTLPRSGIDAPSLPAGARPQFSAAK